MRGIKSCHYVSRRRGGQWNYARYEKAPPRVASIEVSGPYSSQNLAELAASDLNALHLPFKAGAK